MELENLSAIVAAARVDDPSIEELPAAELARSCVLLLDADPGLDAVELARRCVAEHPESDASWVAHLARATVRLRGAPA